MRVILQSSTARTLCFLMIDSSDHITGKTGLSPTVTLSKNGGAFSAPSGAVSEVANGWYKVAGNATDSGTLGSLILHAEATGADPVDVEFEVVGYNPQVALATQSTLDTVDSIVDAILVDTGTDIPATLTTIAAYIDTEVAAIKAKTDNLPSDPADASDISASFTAVSNALTTIAGYIDTEVAAIKAKTDNLPASPAAASDIPSAASIADAVWDEATAGHAGAGSTGAALSAAGAAGDPWSTALPGGYAAGTAGKILSSVPTATQNADALLNRDMSAVSDTNARSPLNALRFFRNKRTSAGTTMNVYKENDTTVAWTAYVETNTAAKPIVTVDPS